MPGNFGLMIQVRWKDDINRAADDFVRKISFLW